MREFIRILLTHCVKVLLRNDLVDQAVLQYPFTDPLTRLANRNAIQDRLRTARGDGVNGVVAYADLDMFKDINDRFGHMAGDAVLIEISHRLQSRLPPDALLARMGGDEFAIFLPHARVSDTLALMEQCLEDVRRPIRLATGQTVTLSMAMGLAAFAGEGIEDTFRAADVAMYAAKHRGRDCVVVYDDDAKGIVAGRRELASAIITLQERNRELHLAAHTDALTRLNNRLALDEVLDLVVGEAKLPYSGVAVAFIDVDHFGKYNRCYDDSGGDQLLQKLGSAFLAASRSQDLVFRKGGEEFVVVLVDVDAGTAWAAAERIRAYVESLGIPHAASETAEVVTVTVGLATGAAGKTVRELMMAADALETAAKNQGRRNQVHSTAFGAGQAPCIYNSNLNGLPVEITDRP